MRLLAIAIRVGSGRHAHACWCMACRACCLLYTPCIVPAARIMPLVVCCMSPVACCTQHVPRCKLSGAAELTRRPPNQRISSRCAFASITHSERHAPCCRIGRSSFVVIDGSAGSACEGRSVCAPVPCVVCARVCACMCACLCASARVPARVCARENVTACGKCEVHCMLVCEQAHVRACMRSARSANVCSVAESRRRCGTVPVRMWPSPGADAAESCGRVPVLMWPSHVAESRC
jgi:hypothetical protein